MLKPGDIVIQTSNNSIWWILNQPVVELESDALHGFCIISKADWWGYGDRCWFDVDPLDDGVVIIGHSKQRPAQATVRAMAALLLGIC